MGLFVLSRIVLLARGFHFDVGLSGNAVQNLDPALLRSHLLQSLWYMHGQPPLWNAFLGAFMHLFPEHWPQAWHVVFLGLGLVVAVSLYFLLRELGIPGGAAVVVSAIFSLSPAVLLSENLLFYDYPSLAVLTATALGVALFVRRPTFVRGLAVFSGAGALVLSRTLFQVWWLLALAGLLLIACRGYRGVVLWSCALPLALVAGVYAKNWVMYGVPSTTSWTGMGVARAAVQALPLAERRRLVARGKLHPVSLVKPLAGLDNYEAVGIVRARPTGIPVLDEVSGHEYPRNLENKTYIRISRLYWKDDLWVVRHRPRAYARAVRTALADFFTSPTIGAGGQGDDAKIRRYDTWFDNVVYGRFGRGRVGKLLVAAYIVALGFGLWVGVRRLRPRADVVTVTVTFAALTILYVTVVGNLAEVGENYRFRFILDPLAISVVAVAVRGLWRRSRGLSRGAGVAR